MSRIIDLTMPVSDHFRWPVERRLLADQAKGDLFQVTWVGLPVHGFTHMDSPKHFFAEGKTTDDIPLEKTVGEAALLDLGEIKANEELTPDRLAGAGGDIRPDDILILKSCWGRQRSVDTPEFWSEAPFLGRAAAEWLLAQKPRAVAFDFPQDYTIRLLLKGEVRPLEEHVSHDVLLRNEVVLIEYLTNTEALTAARLQFCCLPLKLPTADGAPARVIAWQD
jgi:kynurenine formamidase